MSKMARDVSWLKHTCRKLLTAISLLLSKYPKINIKDHEDTWTL
jgi:hypothetical protein